MKPKKLIRYRIPVSVKFPATHPKKGEKTHFVTKIELALKRFEACTAYDHKKKESIVMWEKLHTIRANYDLWANRFEKINRGEAVLELYYWDGKPYLSKTITVCQLGKDDGIGIQKIESFLNQYAFVETVGAGCYEIETIAKNDGLSLEDFASWFKGYDLSQPMAIIHFTPFRYDNTTI